MADPLISMHLAENFRGLLRTILLIMAAGLAVILVSASMTVTPLEMSAPVLLILAASSALYLLRSGRVAAACYVIIATLLCAGVIAVISYGSIRSITNLAFVGAVVAAGIFLERRALIATLLVTSAVVGGLIYAEWSGMMTSLNRPVGLVNWIVFSVSLLNIGLVIHYARFIATEALARQQREIEERKQVEAARWQSEERLRLSMEVAQQGWFDLDLKTGEVKASEQFAKIIGAKPDDRPMNQQAWMGSIHGDDRPSVMQVFGECLESGETRQMDYRMRTRSGEWKWIRSIARVVQYDAQNKPQRMSGTHADITELKRADQGLKESEERYRALVELSPIGIFVHRDGRFLYLNPTATALLGAASANELIGKPILELVHPDFRDLAQKRVDSAQTGTINPMNEQKLVRLNGSFFDVAIQGIPIQYQGMPAIQVSFLDITERKQAEAARRESESRLSAVFHGSPIGISVTKVADGVFVDMNDVALGMLGYQRDEVIGRTAADLRVFVDPAQREEGMRRLRKLGHVEQLTFDIRKKSGATNVVEYSGRIIEVMGEQCVVGMWVDVTARKVAEAELRKTVAFSESLSEAMPLPVFHKDASGRYSGCNSAFARFIGKDKEAIVGKTVFEVTQQDVAQAYRDKDLELLNDPIGLQTYESKVAAMDGTAHDVIFHKARLTDGDGNPIGIVGVITDISELKKIHAKQVSLETQLRESQKMEALGTLAGGVAHDFNNIVAAIIGNTELARQDVGKDHPALVSLDEIRKASSRAKDLVQQILAFGRRQGLARKVMPLAPVVVESARLLRATMLGAVTLNVACAADAPLVLADPTQIQQVLLNLCNNAWDAIEGKGSAGMIEIRLDAKERNGMSFSCLSVRDNGHGMDEATRSRIFEPFFTTKPVGKGTGLGLAVVHSILKDHEASMEVSSVPGKGTTFVVHFPAAQASEDAASLHAPTVVTRHGQGKHVLYVDDDEAIVFLMKRLLERQGFRVSGFTNPREALAAVQANPGEFDLAVTDFNMPGMSGLEVASALREIRADLPLVLASGYITDELRQKAPAAGVRELIYKPNTVDDLCAAVARFANAQITVGS